jgi:extracellular factor (EF) 3-hydroxypalmitic acid methyl ester biosynthesis protein
MEPQKPSANSEVSGGLVLGQTSTGQEFRGTLLRLTRHAASFETYDPLPLLRLSETLTDFSIVVRDRVLYRGRAVLNHLVQTGVGVVCEVALGDHWQDVTFTGGPRLREELEGFLRDWHRLYQVRPEFKVAIADLHTFLHDLRLWLEQVELGIRSSPRLDRVEAEREVLGQLEGAVVPAIAGLFERFEHVARGIEEDLRPAHRAFGKRQLHPLLLSSPFVYRTFNKPLGHAGDYEMVNMMFRNPYEGGSLFAKAINTYALNLPPIQAHRNRIGYLTEVLTRETLRVSARGRPLRVFNMGCGPAQEVQRFCRDCAFSDRAEFSLVDFDEETLNHLEDVLQRMPARSGRRPAIHLQKKSLLQLLREGGRAVPGTGGEQYDLVYCAGLFDYLADNLCRRALEIFHAMLAPGGLLVVTNVDENPSREEMEYFLDWYVIRRDPKDMAGLLPAVIPPETARIQHDLTGVNILMEARKPDATHG